MEEVKDINSLFKKASTVIATGESMDVYLSSLRESISNAVLALENEHGSTAAMYIGEAQLALKHIDAIWRVIMKRDG